MTWVAAGGTRVLQTIIYSKSAASIREDIWGLANWMDKLFMAVWSHQVNLRVKNVHYSDLLFRLPMLRGITYQ